MEKESFRVETAVSQNVSFNYSASVTIFTLKLLKRSVVYYIKSLTVCDFTGFHFSLHVCPP